MRVPLPNYAAPGSFGSLELRQGKSNEFIGQRVDYADAALVDVRAVTVDSFALPRLDFLKVDVEGLEQDVLDGARESIARHHPMIMVEYIKAGPDRILATLDGMGYQAGHMGINIVAVHRDDPSRGQVKFGA
jgi:hypothetical protein